ncbi:hypothetical protein CVS30_11300 [Arthrobacter psychrolactophilus]|uniref:FHA domain-containing protein n=1 Tax=Arthrobacter psychrolactophilus TaxID=92442 RepID=A0A2V5JFG7_9MICC|nr:FHA domain-containing protein [Arthrobacter psychrolactophilus]PYI38307.1 hypothetical protein CVS30_11300 [Arthrobacter psychrolactophilus]
MVSTTYSTGSWLGIVRSGSLIVLERGTDPAIVGALWDYLGHEPTIHGILNEVTAKFGTALTSMPPFAIVLQSDRLHIILRGDITLVARTVEGVETASGQHVATWSERSLPLAQSIELVLAESEPIEEAIVLPLSEGVVQLRSVLMLAVGSAAPGTQPSDVEPSAPEEEPVAAELVTPVVATLAPAADVAFEAKAEVEEAPAQETQAEAAAAVEHDVADDDVELEVPETESVTSLEDAVVNADDAAGEPEAELSEDAAEGVERVDSAEFANTEVAAAEEPIDPEYDAETLAQFAKAAEAADAEWNAQLASLEGPDALDAFISATGGLTSEHIEEENSAEPEILPEGSDTEAFLEEPEDVTLASDDEAAGQAPAFVAEQDGLDTDPAEDAEPVAYPVSTAHVVPPMPSLPPTSAAALVEVAEERFHDDGTVEDVEPETVTEAQAEEHGEAESDAEADAAADAEADTEADDAADTETDSVSDPVEASEAEEGDEPTEQQPETRPITGTMVLARLCSNGHANPPNWTACFDCGAILDSEPREVGRPRLGAMRISSGEVVDLDHSLIIGRQPSLSQVLGGAMPRLVQVVSENGDISRSHVEVRLDQWEVVLVDLNATNGTVLIREGAEAYRLGQGEEVTLENGDIAELGDGVSLLFEGLL